MTARITRELTYNADVSDSGASASISYKQWSALIAEHFFNPQNKGRTVFFAVDSRVLADVSGLAEEAAVESLTSAVRDQIAEWRIKRLRNLTEIWKRESWRAEPPPATAFLAFVVLAATRMGENHNFSAANFYVPLRQLLDSEDKRVGAPGDFADHIQYLWESVREWLRVPYNGEIGLLPPRPDTHYVNIVEALQFAVVRASHFRKLEDFFRRIGLEPGENIEGSDLVEHLKAYLRNRNADWARRLLRFCEEHPSTAASMVSEEARKWDGLPRDSRTGRAIGRLALCFNSVRDCTLNFIPKWDDRLPRTVHIQWKNEIIELNAHSESGADTGWFEPNPLDPPGLMVELLSSGFDTVGGTYQFEFQESDAFAFAYDEWATCWTSVNSMMLEVPYHVMVRDAHRDEVLSFFRAVSAQEPSLLLRYPASWPTGWSLITNVRIDVRPLEKVPEVLRALIPSGSGPRLRTRDGLKVGIRATRNCYLVGGEPVVELNSLETNKPMRISLCDPLSDAQIGDVFEIDTSRFESGQVPLWGIGFSFHPGVYKIEHGKSALKIQFVDGITETGGEGMSSVSTQLSTTSTASGTRVNGASGGYEPYLVRAPDYRTSSPVVFIIGRDRSECHEIRIPDVPSLRNLSWTRMIDAWCEFEPQWVIDASREWRATPYNPLVLPPLQSERSTSPAWKLAVRNGVLESDADESITAVWTEYKKLLGALDG